MAGSGHRIHRSRAAARSIPHERGAWVPTVGQVKTRRPDERARGAEPPEEHDKLQFEEDDRVDARAPPPGIELPYPLRDEAEVRLRLALAVEVVRGDQRPKRARHRLVEAAGLGRTEHRGPPGRHVRIGGIGVYLLPSGSAFFNTLYRYRKKTGSTRPFVSYEREIDSDYRNASEDRNFEDRKAWDCSRVVAASTAMRRSGPVLARLRLSTVGHPPLFAGSPFSEQK